MSLVVVIPKYSHGVVWKKYFLMWLNPVEALDWDITLAFRLSASTNKIKAHHMSLASTFASQGNKQSIGSWFNSSTGMQKYGVIARKTLTNHRIAWLTSREDNARAILQNSLFAIYLSVQYWTFPIRLIGKSYPRSSKVLV